MRFSTLGFMLTLLLLETYGAPLDNAFQSARPENFPDESAVVSSRKVIKTAENGQDYEYEYLYYYDDSENDTAADVRDDLLLDLTKQEKSSTEPKEDLQSIAEAAAFSETSHMGIQMKNEHPATTEEVHVATEVPSVTPAVTTTPAPVTTPKPERLEKPSDVRKTRPSSSSNRVRPRTTSTTPVPKAAVPEKETETQTGTRKTPSRGKNRFSVRTTERTVVETSSEISDVAKSEPTRTSSSSRRRINSANSGRQTVSSTPVAAEQEASTKRRNEKKTSSRGSAPEVTPVQPKAVEDTAKLQPVQPEDAQAPTATLLHKSSFDFEAEIKALDVEEDLRSKASDAVPAETPVAAVSPVEGDVLIGQDEAAAHQLIADAKAAEQEVMLDAVEPLRTVTESTTAALAIAEGRSTEPSVAQEEPKVEPMQSIESSDLSTLKTEAETTTASVISSVSSKETVSVTEAPRSTVAVESVTPQAVQEPQQVPTAPQVDAKEESKPSQLGGRSNRLGQPRGRTSETARGTGSRRTTKAPVTEESTTTTTTTAAPSTRSLFNNRGRVGLPRFGSSKQTSKTEEASANSVTEATTTTTTTTTTAKVVTRRPFGPALRRTSTTTTETPKEETKPAEPAPAVEATPSTTAASNSVARGKQRFSVLRGFRVSDGVNSDSPAIKTESTSTTEAPVETSTALTKPSKTAPRTRPSVLLRSRTSTTEASEPAEAADRVDAAPETPEVETVQDEPKQTIATKKLVKSFRVEASTEAPATTPAQSTRLNLLKNRPALVVSERPKTARNDVNLADRKNRFSTFLKKSANSAEEVKPQADETKEEPAEGKTPEAVASVQEAVEEPKTAVEAAEAKPQPIQNRLRGNRRPGQIATSRRGAEVQPSN